MNSGILLDIRVANVVGLAFLFAILTIRSVGAAETRAFIYATDFSTGTLADIQFGPPRIVTPDVASVSPDAVIRWFDGLLYVVNRFNFDNIQIMDPASGFSMVRQFSVGNGSNPHDIYLVSPTKAYVTRYSSPDLWIVNPQTGAHMGTISLAQFADADGIPEMDRMAVRGGRLFLTVQRLDRSNFFLPTDSSQVVVLDLATDTLVDVDASIPGVQGILLPYQNPSTEFIADPSGMLVVGCSGGFGTADGGIVRINPNTLKVVGTEISEVALGGDVNDVALLDAARGYAVVSDESFNTLLKAYDRTTGVATGTPFSTPGFYIADAEVNNRGELWLCDRTPGNPGVRVFDALSGTQLTSVPLDTRLPPQDITFDGTGTVDVPLANGAPTSGGLVILGVFPNPASSLTQIRFRLATPTLVSGISEIYDVSGRLLDTQPLISLAAGEHVLAWDGRTRAGSPAPAGLYLIRVSVGPYRATARVTRR